MWPPPPSPCALFSAGLTIFRPEHADCVALRAARRSRWQRHRSCHAGRRLGRLYETRGRASKICFRNSHGIDFARGRRRTQRTHRRRHRLSRALLAKFDVIPSDERMTIDGRKILHLRRRNLGHRYGTARRCRHRRRGHSAQDTVTNRIRSRAAIPAAGRQQLHRRRLLLPCVRLLRRALCHARAHCCGGGGPLR